MKKIAGVLGIWLGLAALAWLWLLPKVPHGREWFWLLLAGPPAFVVLSVAGDLVGEAFHRLPGVRHAEGYAEARTSEQRFSWLRVLIYLGTTLLFVALVLGGVWLARLIAA